MTTFFSIAPLYIVFFWIIRQLSITISLWLSQKDQLIGALIFNHVSLFFWPFSAVQWTRLGNLWGDLNAWSKAERCFARALKIQPNWIEAQLGAGTAALLNLQGQQENWQVAHQHLLDAYILRRGTPWNMKTRSITQALERSEYREANLHRAWQSQVRWLQTQKIVPAQIMTNWVSTGGPDRAFYLEQPRHTTDDPLQSCNAQKIVQTYQEQSGLVWYDDFLQPEALHSLLDFCQRSTFWHHYYQNAYLGAYLDDGFSCPLLYQIAVALKTRFPELLADLHLVYMWSFKCHQRGKGIALHHDSAVVNVNFWLTPDQANQAKDSGGLCVYTKAPPEHWDLERYRLSQEQMKLFIKQNNVRKHCVPYKQNRVVIFNSRLLHETQDFQFQPGYLNQRINVTLLFGKRPLRYHAQKELPSAFMQS